MRILFIGDIFGRPGRTIVKERLPGIVRQRGIDLIIANGENSAAGFGITPALAEELFELNIDVITTGNHVWDKREIIDYFQMMEGNGHGPARRVLRPANYPSDMPGSGVYEGFKGKVPYAVINLQGRVFMASNDDPFRRGTQSDSATSRPAGRRPLSVAENLMLHRVSLNSRWLSQAFDALMRPAHQVMLSPL